MSEPGMRPGGLTALAVINFILAALELHRREPSRRPSPL